MRTGNALPPDEKNTCEVEPIIEILQDMTDYGGE